jgi:hypothetical protein
MGKIQHMLASGNQGRKTLLRAQEESHTAPYIYLDAGTAPPVYPFFDRSDKEKICLFVFIEPEIYGST